jgi:hypothetical protein
MSFLEPMKKVQLRHLISVSRTWSEDWPIVRDTSNDLIPDNEQVTGYCIPALDVINGTFGGCNHWRALLPAMAIYTDVFHAVVCAMGAARASLVHKPLNVVANSLGPEVLVHRGKALSKLKIRLACEKHDAAEAAILTILFLLVSPTSSFLLIGLRQMSPFDTLLNFALTLQIFDRGVGNANATNAHLAQINFLLGNHGGIQAVKSNFGLRELLIHYRLLRGETMEEVLSSSPRSTVRPAHSMSTEDLQKLPAGFRGLAITGALADTTVALLGRFSTTKEPRYIHFSPAACLAWSYPMFYNVAASHVDGLVNLALLRFRLLRAAKIRHDTCPCIEIAMNLTKRLHAIALPYDTAERRAYLWIWLVTIDFWSIMPPWKPQLLACGGHLLCKLPNLFPEIVQWCALDMYDFAKDFVWHERQPRWAEQYWEDTIRSGNPPQSFDVDQNFWE